MKTNGADQDTKGGNKAQDNSTRTLQDRVRKMYSQFEDALPKTITATRMMRIILTVIRQNPKLAACSEESFFGAVLTALQLGLEPNTPLGQCYLIPYKGEVNFQMGYHGLIELAYRTNKYRRIDAEVVYEGDVFEYNYGLDPILRHKPKGKQEKPLYVYAIYELTNGGKTFKVWTWDAVIQHGYTYSKAFDSEFSPWKTSAPSMAKKTMIIQVLNYGPRSAEIAEALSADGSDSLNARKVEEGTHRFIEMEYKHIEDDRNNPNRVKTEAPGANAKPDPVPAANQRSEKPNSTLYPEDEAAALDAQYEREQAGDLGPDFDGGRK